MSYSVFSTHRFEKELKRLVKKFPSLKKEYTNLINDLAEKPDSGVSLGNNCYKIRLSLASKGKGKRAGARVIIYLCLDPKSIYFLTIYDKSEKEDVKPNDLKMIVESLHFH
ncbi:MAG TPA: hypothetical protein DCR46_05225 [Cytophagales bacterium]|nr:hypothetical protein [Cytophagales bacterium]